MSEVVINICPPRCDAGGIEADGGHLFTESRVIEWHEAGWSDYWQRVLPRRPALESEVCSKCGLSYFDWFPMRPIPLRNEVLETCPGCDYDEAEGGLIDQCDDCKRRNGAKGSLMVQGEWHDAYNTTGGAVRDGCDAACNGRVYVKPSEVLP